jgi:F-type H+-transporting ATPase subunit alpha
VEDVRRFEAEFSHFMDNNKADLLKAIREKKELNDEVKNQLKAALIEFKGRFQSSAKKA